MEYTLGYREVIPNQTLPEKWKEIILSTGGSQSTLQDIKVPERAGGYCYKDTSKHFTRNRFISWRIIHDVLELVEHSLDINLTNNRVRYKFTDTPILDGISIHETTNSVIILIITVSSIHKLSFSHPNKHHDPEQIIVSHSDSIMQSIFNEASTQNASDPQSFQVITNTISANYPVAHAAASLIMPDEEAMFALAYSSGAILLLRANFLTGLVQSTELKEDTMVPRFLSGIATALRGRAETEVTMSIVLHACGDDVYLFALCREGHLRMWSSNKIQCLAVVDVATNNRISDQNFQNHALKEIINSENELYLCTYLKYNLGGEFCILKVLQDSGIFKLARVCTLLAPNQHLVDFSFTMTRLWAVWRTTDVDGVAVTHAQLPLDQIKPNCVWESAVLVQPADKDYIINDSCTDPRQAYIDYIFYPGQFSLIDITRALSIYRRSNYLTDTNLTPSVLKERVSMAVEAEIQAEVMDYELMDEDYIEIVNRCWSKFYSCVVQYHLNGSRPVGLLLLPNVYGVILLKKSSFSLLRPMESLEHLMLCNEVSFISRFKTTPVLAQDDNICQDVINLMSALVVLEKNLSDELKFTFEKDLYQLKSPDVIIENLLSKSQIQMDEIFTDFDFQTELYHRLENIKDMSSAMAMLLEALTYDLGQPNKMELNQNEFDNSNVLLNTNNSFGSYLGISTMSEIVTQIATLRFSICRNLLILQRIALLRPELFDSQSLHSIKSSLAPRTVVLTQAYYIVMWICESNASITPSQAVLESSIQRFNLLKMSNCRSIIGQRQQRSLSLLELFIQYGAKQYIYKLTNHSSSSASNSVLWHVGMLSHVTLIAQLIWPISNNFFFPEWLLSSCQFLLVQEYVRLLSTWCEWNGASRKFILAMSFLEMGEPQKACDYFLRASNGVIIDTYMSNLFLRSNTVSESNALVYYYLKVIEMFEHHVASDCVIELALTAMTVSEKDDVNIPTLHSIVFEHHLNLEHYIEAYNCLNTNPDNARRIDCLRQLVVTLFNKQKLSSLVSFPYVDMYHDLEKIIETKARSVDLVENNFYDFLYSFYINKGNVRKAASVMYEQAMRLRQEPFSLVIIARQAHCLLACINALHLVNEKYRWIVRPIIDQNLTQQPCNSSKMNVSDSNMILPCKSKPTIEAVEIKDVEREYILADAQLKLATLNPNVHITSQANPTEIVSIMSNIGLYLNAFDVCEHFKLCKSSVIGNLASLCTRLSQKEKQKSWDWINQNDVFDFSPSTLNTITISWRLLQYFTLTYEIDGESKLHKAVAKELFNSGSFLPEWLLSSYAKRNAAELLRLMIQMGRLEEAADFTLEFIKAALGKSKKDFGLKMPLLSINPPVCLPFNTFEVLLLELEYACKDDETYLETYETLRNSMDNYVTIVQRTSLDMIELKK